ncbi:endonuclease/exonuclease/phosphatase family protein [Sphingobacterium sp. UT-1RO-CII-1]|uniref:endonuclease/exonuclease/phosphatase family protein n=1 Tax=Sphingobacterium sp. UT-1RO-CII-1 TaxID=2995225 RepID=UPI00227A652A|nr:endonuclease/exonuclease/phosphatase family protein [Sphingobacterium sp. UT-1RO-CII-1]MCY4780263.1 endonuclease/exonuclease/phosphatase family protein [Sphingobacterium sp. UT-1RO-CII-1]
MHYKSVLRKFKPQAFIISGLCLLLCLLFSSFDLRKDPTELKVLQINIWQEGTMVPGGFEAIGQEIIDKDPDIVTFSEVRNYKGTDFIARIKSYLEEKGRKYYGESSHSSLDVGLIAKYPIVQQSPLYSSESKMGGVLKTELTVAGKNVLFYSVHLDYTHYACYLPRGYSGVTWKRLENPIVDADEIILANRQSLRDDAIQDIILDTENVALSTLVIIAGDFNEPSHLDWVEETKFLFDHQGVVVPWDCSVLLQKAGFVDSFRSAYPNPVTHPGFTFPSYNKDVDINKLTWAPLADERDRIDYIYYRSDKSVRLKEVFLVGPVETIVKGEVKDKDSKDVFLVPENIWPSDHKAVMASFLLDL